MVKIVSTLGSNSVIPPTPPPLLNPTPLILHLDINETILIGDEAGGDTREESLNKILAKSAFVKLPPTFDDNDNKEDTSHVVPTHWWDGTEIGNENSEDDIDKAPPLYSGWVWPPKCVPYYRTAYKSRAKTFVEHHGRPYKSLYDKMESILSLEDDELPSVVAHMLPSIFHTLAELSSRGEPFRLVLRSFGSDIEQVAEAISEFAQGKHPDYPDFRNEALIATPDDLVVGRWSTTAGEIGGPSFSLYDKTGAMVASGDDEVLDWIQQRTISGIQDDYLYWSKHHCCPGAGKPVWAPSRGRNQHHVLFDDNIHNLENDSIASVRLQANEGEPFRTLTGREIREMQGLYLVRVPTIEPILNSNDWFLQQIDKARAHYAALVASADGENVS